MREGDIRLPTIHLNGTSAKSLFDNHCEALGSLRDCIRKLDLVAPNGRDFYPQGDHAIGEALKEHDERVKRIISVVKELEEIAEHIMDSGKAY